jgi:hypothetical protein
VRSSRVHRRVAGAAALAGVTFIGLACGPPPPPPTTTSTSTTTTSSSTTTTSIPPSPTGLVINEIDYDQVGTDTEEFVELENTSGGTLDLTGTDLVFVNGNNGAVYLTVPLGVVGLVAPGAYVVVGDAPVTSALPAGTASITLPGVDTIQNGAPDAVTILDTNHSSIIDSLSYEGSVLNAALPGFAGPVALDEGYPHTDPVGPVDSNVFTAALVRFPDGADTDDERTDWVLSSTPTPGATNFA